MTDAAAASSGPVGSASGSASPTDAHPRSPTWSWPAVGVGALAGFLSGLFGVGGGIVIVPALMTIMAMERKHAHGTSLAATLPIAAASLVTYAAGSNVDWPVAACLASGAVAGSILGTQLLQVIPKRPLTIIFIVTILTTAVRLVLSGDTLGRDDLTVLTAALLVAIGFLTGTLSGLLGIGGGVVMVPAMVVLFSMPPVLAKGTSVAVIVPSSLMGTIRNRKHRNANLPAAAAVGVAGVITAVIGSLISDFIADSVSNALFAALLIVVACLQIRTLSERSTSPGAPSSADGSTRSSIVGSAPADTDDTAPADTGDTSDGPATETPDPQ